MRISLILTIFFIFLLFFSMISSGCILKSEESRLTQVTSIKGTITADSVTVLKNKPGIINARVYAVTVDLDLVNFKPSDQYPNAVTSTGGFFEIFGIPLGRYVLVIDANDDGLADDYVFDVSLTTAVIKDIGEISVIEYASDENIFFFDLAKTFYTHGETLEVTIEGINSGSTEVKLGIEVIVIVNSETVVAYNSFEKQSSIDVAAGKRVAADAKLSWMITADTPVIARQPYYVRLIYENGSYAGYKAVFTLNGTSQPGIELLTPDGGERIERYQSVTWKTSSNVPGTEFSSIKLEYSVDSGAKWNSLIDGLEDTGTYQWDTGGVHYSSQYLIRVTGMIDGKTVSDTSDTNFTAGFWKLASNTGPVARNDHAMAYDSIRGRTVVFGGATKSDGNLGDTWEWDGNVWTEITPVDMLGDGNPTARQDCRMEFEIDRNVCILFGGNNGSNETWAWDGSEWRELAPATVPPGRQNHSLVFDPTRQVLVLFGGSNGPNANVWELSWTDAAWGCIWTKVKDEDLAGETTPLPREEFGYAWDPQRSMMVICGGKNQNAPIGCFQTTDTWGWDGTEWTLINDQDLNAKSLMSMAGFPPRNSIIMFGGKTGTNLSDTTWELKDDTWMELHTVGPFPLTRSQMVYDSGRQKIVMFGGGSGFRHTETWEFTY
ncbi:hypothetical protein KAJ27_07580 [bacterium]|nr:hypothetical protein [bacterium]